MVGFACDGASVMLGKTGVVATKLRAIKPSLVIVHCLVNYKQVLKCEGKKL
jgi:predicted transcriptional regulator